jgi:hypothetical protein
MNSFVMVAVFMRDTVHAVRNPDVVIALREGHGCEEVDIAATHGALRVTA